MRARARDLLAAVLTGTLTGFVALSVSASAHPAGDWYGGKWRTGTINGVTEDQVVDWRFVSNVPTNGQRGAIKRGAQDWNEENGTPHTSPMKFHFESAQPDYGSIAYGSDGFCSNSDVTKQSEYQRDKIGWISFGGDADTTQADGDPEPLADLTPCILRDSDSRLHMFMFRMRVNKDYPYYRGTDAVPDDKYDLWSIAGHEFGHATGFNDRNGGHWPETWDVCPGIDDSVTSYRHTMCAKIIRGNKAMRNLGDHDLHTFTNYYQ